LRAVFRRCRAVLRPCGLYYVALSGRWLFYDIKA
jgi:hypothetical protein